jgi:3-oxoadipate enol-lactonase
VAAVQFVRLGDAIHHYRMSGVPASGRAVVFINSLGTDLRIWADVMTSLAGEVPALAYDMRGHGLSDVGATPYTLPMLAADLAALMDHLRIGAATVCGVSIGGMVAQQLHVLRPDLVSRLVLCDTAPRIGDSQSWAARIAAIRDGGLEAIADAVLARWFTPAFRSARVADYVGYRNMFIRQPVEGYVAACEALATADLTPFAGHIDVPTLCLAGDQDGSTPPAVVAALAAMIRGARFEIIRDCGHLPSIEQPEMLVAALRAFTTTPQAEVGDVGS